MAGKDQLHDLSLAQSKACDAARRNVMTGAWLARNLLKLDKSIPLMK
jgi:hypothetical protein